MANRWAARAAVTGLGLASLLGYAAAFPWVAGWGSRSLVGYVGLFAGLFFLYLLAAWVARRASVPDRALLGLILGFGLLFRLAVLPTPVLLSSDVYRYLWDGRVQRAGVSPYRYPPAAPELAPLRDGAIYPRINRPTRHTVYPPGAQALFALVAGVAPDSLLAWRLFLLGCEVATTLLLLRLLHRVGVASTAVVLYAWAPLAVFEGVQAAHLELALLPVLLSALFWRQAARMARAGIALGFAVLMKLYPAVLLAAWWRWGDWRLPVGCAAVVAAGYLPYAWGVGPSVLGFLPEYFESAEDFNIGLRFFLTGWIPFDSPLAREAVRRATMEFLVGTLAIVLVRIALRRREGPIGIARATMSAVAAYLVLVPTAMHAWYVVWILPFLTIWPSPAWLWFSGAVSLSYLKYAGDSAGFPFWIRAVEYVPLYGLLVWEWRTGRPGVPFQASEPGWPAGVIPPAVQAR